MDKIKNYDIIKKINYFYKIDKIKKLWHYSKIKFALFFFYFLYLHYYNSMSTYMYNIY